MHKTSSHAYASHGLLVGMYTSRDRQLSLDTFEKEVNGVFDSYRSHLAKSMANSLATSQGRKAAGAAARDYLEDLYRPHFIATFGRFDCGILTLVDDYEVMPWVSGLRSAMGERLDVSHILQCDEQSRLIWKKSDVAQALRTESCVAVCRLKLHLMFLSVLGHHVYRFVAEMISAILHERDRDLKVIVCEPQGWPDLIMVVTGDSFEKIGEFIVDVGERNFADLWNKLPAPAARKQRQAELRRMYGKSQIGRRISTISEELKDGLPVNSHVFLTTSTTLGYSLKAHKEIYEATTNPPKEEEKKAPHVLEKYRGWGKIAVQMQACIKPGHLGAQMQLSTGIEAMAQHARVLTATEVLAYFGDSDFISSVAPIYYKPGASALTTPYVVSAVDYVSFAIRKRRELDAFPSGGPRGRGKICWKPQSTSDYYELFSSVGVPISAPHIAGTATDGEVAPFAEIVRRADGPLADEDADRELLMALRLPLPYIHGLEAVLKTYRATMRDPFSLEWILEVQDYVEALREYVRDVGQEGDRVRTAHHISESVGIFERAFSHRAGYAPRSAPLTGHTIELKSGLARPVSAIHALLHAILQPVGAMALEPGRAGRAAAKRRRAGAVAVLVADPNPEIVPLVTKHCRGMGVVLNGLAVWRPELLSDLFHEGGHMLGYDAIWREWRKEQDGDSTIRSVRADASDATGKTREEDIARLVAVYLALGRECAAELLRYAFGCWEDMDLYAKIFMSISHSMGLESYSRQTRRGLDGQHVEESAAGEADVLPARLIALTESCIKFLCVRAVVAERKDSPVFTPEGVIDALHPTLPYCPELAAMVAARKKDKEVELFFEGLAKRFEWAYRILTPTLGDVWGKLQVACPPSKFLPKQKEQAFYEGALAEGRAVLMEETGAKPDAYLPAVLHYLSLRRSYGELREECAILPRRDLLGKIMWNRIPPAAGTNRRTPTGVFLDRKLGGMFLATPQARQTYFRRRAALFTSLWHYTVRSKERKLLQHADKLLEAVRRQPGLASP